MLKLVVSGLVVAGAFFAGNKVAAPQDDKKMPSQDEMAKIMAMYEKAATPSEMHKKLSGLAGKWDQKNTFNMGGAPQESSGVAEYRELHGGRFVVCETACKMMMPGPDGKPVEKSFSGFNLLGYDNTLKQFQSCWCDSMGTGMFLSTGTPDASGKIITYEGVMKDAMTPNGRPWKMVYSWESDDKHTIELWDAFDGKNLEKMGTIVETRRK
jgi:hypothetical protein